MDANQTRTFLIALRGSLGIKSEPLRTKDPDELEPTLIVTPRSLLLCSGPRGAQWPAGSGETL